MSRLQARKNSNVIIVRKSRRPKKVGEIILPDESRTVSSQFVVVVSHGDGITEDEKKAMSTIKEGDVLLVEKHAGHIVKYDEDEYLAIDIGQVYGKVEGINRRINV